MSNFSPRDEGNCPKRWYLHASPKEHDPKFNYTVYFTMVMDVVIEYIHWFQYYLHEIRTNIVTNRQSNICMLNKKTFSSATNPYVTSFLHVSYDNRSSKTLRTSMEHQ